MSRILKGVGYIAVVIPLVVLGQCMYQEINQRRELESLCAGARPGSALGKFLDDSARTAFKVRMGGTAGKNDAEWFDREYLRLGEYLKKTKKTADDYTVVFAKPGIGYYACFVVHKNGLVQSAWFEDRSN